MKGKLNVDIIKEYIKSNDLTVKEFCSRCKISVSAYYRMMNGGNFYLSTLYAISKITEMPLRMFFK